VVCFARRSEGWEADSLETLRALDIPAERLSPVEAARLYPSLRTDDLAFAVLEPDAGVLRASDGVSALVRRAQAGGLRLDQRVAHPDDPFEADQVIWACGAWLGRLFPSLVQLRVTRQELVLFDAGPDWEGTPGWLDFDASGYGHGLIEPHGMKVASDREGAEVEPGLRPPSATDESLTAARDYLAHRFPALASAPIRSSPSCHYSLTPDGNFLFAAHPERDNVWLLGGGSGHGYKHGPTLAQHAADVLEGTAAPEPRFGLGERTPSRAFRTAGS
jgi:sarcosine oxidase